MTDNNTSSSSFNDQIKKDICKVCDKVVYPMDKLVADDKIYHKTCLRCGHCKKVLSLGNYAALNNVFYCKPHFKQLFAVKGNYTDGFADSQELKGTSTPPVYKGSKPSSISSLKSESDAAPIHNIHRQKSPILTETLSKSPLANASSVDALVKSIDANHIHSLSDSNKDEEIRELKKENQRLQDLLIEKEKEIESLRSSSNK